MANQRKLSSDEAAELTDRIVGLAGSNLPLFPGLMALGEEFPSGPLRRTTLELARALEAGVPIDEAIQRQEGRMAPQLLGLIRAGLRTGQLGDLLSRFSAYITTGSEVRRRIRLSMAYPLISLSFAFVIFTFECTTLIPQFEVIFRDFGLPIPVMTQVLIQASHVFLQASPAMLSVAGLCVLGWIGGLFLAVPTRRAIAGRLPIVGTVWRSTSLAEFFHLLALMLEGQMPLAESVRLAGDGVMNSDLKRGSEEVAKQVESGRGLADSLASVPRFPRGFTHLLKWAEKPGSLPEVLHMIAEMVEARAQAQLAFASSLVGVLSIFVIIGAVFMVVIGLLLPMVSVIYKLSG